MNPILFETDQFRIDQQHLYILRKGFVVHQFQFGQLSQCEIKRASPVKNQGGLLAFGLACFLPLCWSSYFWVKIYSQAEVGFLEIIATGRAVAIQISVVGFCAFVGFLSMKQTLSKSTVLKIQTLDSKSYLFDLSPIEKTGTLSSFVSFLKKHLSQISINI